MNPDLYLIDGLCYLEHISIYGKIFVNRANYIIGCISCNANITFDNYGDASLGYRRNTLPNVINTLELMKIEYIKN